MLRDSSLSVRRVRVTTPMKAQSINSGEIQWFPEGAVLWHLEIGEHNARFMEMGGRETWEVPIEEFTPRVKTLSR